MKDIICVAVAKDHTYECACDIIGRAGESETARLEITVPHSFTDWWTYIEFRKPNGELCRTPNLEVADGVANYDIPLHLLTESGEMEVQLVFQKESGEIWKSSKKKYIITESLNATDGIPDKEDFITEAQAVLDALSGEVQEIADALANDPDFADAVIEACGGQTKINTINGTPLRFFVGTQAEYEALTEAQKKNLFAVITDDTTKDALLSAIKKLTKDTEQLQEDIDDLEKDSAETYGNFNNEWQSGKSGNLSYPQFSTAGTYQVRVKVDYIFDFETSAIVYWDGVNATVINLPTAYRNTTASIEVYYYRLIISADGSTHIQYVKVGSAETPDGVKSWAEIPYYESEAGNNVSIFYRKIL